MNLSVPIFLTSILIAIIIEIIVTSYDPRWCPICGGDCDNHYCVKYEIRW